VQQQWQYAHAHQQDDQQRAFEQALLAVQSAQSATAITPSSRDFEKRVAILQAEEKALQACAEENERRFAVENAALDSRRHEAAIASGVADNRERAQKKRERALDLFDSGVSAREDRATQREQAVHAREGVLDQSVQNEIQGWLQHIEDHEKTRLPHTHALPNEVAYSTEAAVEEGGVDWDAIRSNGWLDSESDDDGCDLTNLPDDGSDDGETDDADRRHAAATAA
jgi:hypothetical protein